MPLDPRYVDYARRRLIAMRAEAEREAVRLEREAAVMRARAESKRVEVERLSREIEARNPRVRETLSRRVG